MVSQKYSLENSLPTTRNLDCCCNEERENGRSGSILLISLPFPSCHLAPSLLDPDFSFVFRTLSVLAVPTRRNRD
jgi:hypothetical protein